MTLPLWRILHRHDRTRRSRGQSVAEFAVVLPIMLLILAGAVDLGRAFYAYVAVENAAKEGALYGARHPMCDSASSTCPDPRNVRWIVENEAANLKDRSGASQLTTRAACRTPAGGLVQPINDCVNGNIYVVEVTHTFRLVTPILGDIVGSSLTLGASSEATVIEDAFDPAGLEVLVWVDKTGADNVANITNSCVPADPATSVGYYYAPCQDKLNRYNYLQYQEGDSVKFKVRVRNTGNVDLTSLSFSFSINGSDIPKPCSLQGSLARNSPAIYCEFDRTVVASDAVDGIADYLVEVDAEGQAGSLSTGVTSGSGTIKVVPAPLLAVNLRAAPYRLGRDGDGIGGTASYAGGDLSFARTTDPSAERELREPVGWLKVSVVNQGGPASNFALVVTQDGAAVSLPADCQVPASLAAGGSPGDRFSCILPSSLNDSRTYRFVANATARNAKYAGGDPSVDITTETCADPKRVVPNLVDTLAPSADGSWKTVGQARALWQSAGFVGSFSTVPSSAPSNTQVRTQNVTAYTCENVDQNVQAAAR
ncbi:MAG: TadE family protein [Chloroflexota bacterium]